MKIHVLTREIIAALVHFTITISSLANFQKRQKISYHMSNSVCIYHWIMMYTSAVSASISSAFLCVQVYFCFGDPL